MHFLVYMNLLCPLQKCLALPCDAYGCFSGLYKPTPEGKFNSWKLAHKSSPGTYQPDVTNVKPENCSILHCIFKRVTRYPMLILVKYDEQNSRVSDSNTISDLFQRGWAKIRIRSVSPQWLWRCRSSGYRQLCSLWFEYDLCLNRKPPSDHG